MGWPYSGRGLALGLVVLLVAGLVSAASPVAGAGDGALAGVSSTDDAGTGVAAGLAGADVLDGQVGLDSVAGAPLYVPLAPTRVLDTRDADHGDLSAPVGQRQTVTTTVGGVGGVPPDAAVVAINITAITPTRDGFVTVWPHGQPRPAVSSINFPTDAIVGNFVLAELGTDGKLAIYNHNGLTDVVFDVVGYLAPRSPPSDDLAAGGFHTCGRHIDGRVSCWGSNGSGQLGDGTTTNRLTPVAVTGLTDTVQVVAGFNHSCAMHTDGSVSCWGSNSSGQLGDGSGAQRSTPVAVVGITDAVQVAAGGMHTCAMHTDGQVSCWGQNFLGQLGNGSISAEQYTPVTVVGITDAAEITAGTSHTCAMHTNRRMSCWGSNLYGQLGDGKPGHFSSWAAAPVSVVGITDAAEITAGGQHTCVRHADRRMSCWGSNSSGQLGDGTTTERHTPATVAAITDAAPITGGGSHTCARHTDGLVSCWGLNDSGQVGDSTTTERHTPVTVAAITDAARITAGAHHTCVRHTGATVFCWGDNRAGQLGDGTTTNRLTPVVVVVGPP